jgi:hypothetical protein
MQASVDRRYSIQRVVGYRHDHQDFSGQHHDLSASARGGPVDTCAFPDCQRSPSGCVLTNVAAFPGSTEGARTPTPAASSCSRKGMLLSLSPQPPRFMASITICSARSATGAWRSHDQRQGRYRWFIVGILLELLPLTAHRVSLAGTSWALAFGCTRVMASILLGRHVAHLRRAGKGLRAGQGERSVGPDGRVAVHYLPGGRPRGDVHVGSIRKPPEAVLQDGP